MDLITQMQNYVGYLAAFMANTVEHIHTQAPPIVPPPLAQPSSSPTSPSSPSSSSSIPPPPPLDAAFSAAMEEKSFQLSRRVAELQALIDCLPARMATEEEQLQLLRELQRQNEEEEQRLMEAREEAELWQQRLAAVLQCTAKAQLRIATEANQPRTRLPPFTHPRALVRESEG